MPHVNGKYLPSPGPGLPKGYVHKHTRLLKEATLLAAEQVGADGKGLDGLVGYLRMVAMHDVKAFVTLLARILPLQANVSISGQVRQITDGMDQEQAATIYAETVRQLGSGPLAIEGELAPTEAAEVTD